MDRSVTTKSGIALDEEKEESIQNAIIIDRLNKACEIIYSIYKTDQHQKVDRTILTARKHDKSN